MWEYQVLKGAVVQGDVIIIEITRCKIKFEFSDKENHHFELN